MCAVALWWSYFWWLISPASFLSKFRAPIVRAPTQSTEINGRPHYTVRDNNVGGGRTILFTIAVGCGWWRRWWWWWTMWSWWQRMHINKFYASLFGNRTPTDQPNHTHTRQQQKKSYVNKQRRRPHGSVQHSRNASSHTLRLSKQQSKQTRNNEKYLYVNCECGRGGVGNDDYWLAAAADIFDDDDDGWWWWNAHYLFLIVYVVYIFVSKI